MFYETSPALDALGKTLVSEILARYAPNGLRADTFALTLLPFDGPLTFTGGAHKPAGFSHNGARSFYPCSVVKAFYLAAVEAALEAGTVLPHGELDRAMRDMILWSSNTATNYIIDLLTGTTGDTLLPAAEMSAWAEKRGSINRYFASYGWPEMAGTNICQKLMDDERYGREKIFSRWNGHNNHNALTADATARLFHAIFTGQIVTSERCRHMIQLLSRPHDAEFAARPAAQVRGYFGEGLPATAKLWSKCGCTAWTNDVDASWRRHDAAYVELEHGRSFILTAYTEGEQVAQDATVLPGIATLVTERLST